MADKKQEESKDTDVSGSCVDQQWLLCMLCKSSWDTVEMQILTLGLGWGLGSCISNKLPGDASDAGAPHFEQKDIRGTTSELKFFP